MICIVINKSLNSSRECVTYGVTDIFRRSDDALMKRGTNGGTDIQYCKVFEKAERFST